MKNPRRLSYNAALELVRLGTLDLLADNRAEFEADDGDDFDPTRWDEEETIVRAATTIEEVEDVLAGYLEESADLADFMLHCLFNSKRSNRHE